MIEGLIAEIYCIRRANDIIPAIKQLSDNIKKHDDENRLEFYHKRKQNYKLGQSKRESQTEPRRAQP